MNYLVVRKTKSAAINEILVVPETFQLVHDGCEVWALRSGNQVLDVYGQLVRKMKQFHMHGNFDKGAMYVMDYEDLVKVLCSMFGPSDRMRCEMLQAQADAEACMRNHERMDEIEQFLTDFCGGVLKIMWVILAGTFKIIWYCVLTILFMRWMHKKKR